MTTHLQDKLTDYGLAAVALCGVVGVLYWLGSKAVDKVSGSVAGVSDYAGNLVDSVAVTVAPVNPASDKNLVYGGVSSLSDWWDDGVINNSNTFGTFIYEWMHKDEAAW